MTCEELELGGCKITKEDLLKIIDIPIFYWENLLFKGCVLQIKSGKVAIFIDESLKDTEEEMYVLAHEWGHWKTKTLHHPNELSAEQIADCESKANEYAHRILNGIK